MSPPRFQKGDSGPSVLGLPVNVAASKLIGSANFLKPTGRIDVFQRVSRKTREAEVSTLWGSRKE